LKGLVELGTNYSQYSDSKIFEKTDKPLEIADKTINYLIKNTIPVPTYFPKGWTWDKVVKAIQQRPDYWGRVRGVPKVLLDVIGGIKISPIDVDIVRKQSMDEIRREKDRLDREKNYQLRLAISDEERNKIVKTFEEKVKVLFKNETETNEMFRTLFGGGKP